jgi:hypothetical protein
MEKSMPVIQPKTTYVPAKDITTFVGFVVKGVLDVNILKKAAEELITQWPILGGRLIKYVCLPPNTQT